MKAETDLFKIIEENENFLVINKSGDLVCHPTKGDAYSSLIGRLRLYYENQPQVRPSFVNRLDRETSGIILIAKNPEEHASMQRLFEKGSVTKTYLAIIQGVPQASEGVIDKPIGRELNSPVTVKQCILETGAASLTRWKVLKTTEKHSLLEVKPETGRLHQIRVHLSSIGHPLVGDKLYGPDPLLYLEFIRTGWTENLEKHLLVSRQMLHASELKIVIPLTQQVFQWNAPIPRDMQIFLDKHFKL